MSETNQTVGVPIARRGGGASVSPTRYNPVSYQFAL